MLEEIQVAVEDYQKKWADFVSQRRDESFFTRLKPVAVGWKVADQAEYGRLYNELRDVCDKTVETWMNERWVAKLHLKQSTLPAGIEIIKLMQRRPGSRDSVGLDHLDFYSPAAADAEKILKSEKSVKWTLETHDVTDNYQWLSIWFAGTEAKLKPYTVIDLVVRELQELNHSIVS